MRCKIMIMRSELIIPASCAIMDKIAGVIYTKDIDSCYVILKEVRLKDLKQILCYARNDRHVQYFTGLYPYKINSKNVLICGELYKTYYYVHTNET
jgi:hypothetical protein